MRRALSWSLPVVFASMLASSLGGLLYGYAQTRSIDLAGYRDWLIPKGVQLRPFLCVGYMHNGFYLGAALAVPIAWLFLLRSASRARPRAGPGPT